MEPIRDREQQGEAVTLRLVQDHAAELLRFARRFSLCADDAHDAYQRGIEILVRRMRTSPPDNPLNWLRTVIRHECVAVRTERERLLGRQEVDLDREEGCHLEDPSERIAGYERLGQVAEALQRLKPQEVTALVLRAQGLSYKEICAHTGWTYTKCNRAVTEGRRALRDRLGAIESGAECDRWLPQLSLLADGEATARQLADLRPHLRACPACRATLRRFHDAPGQVAALVPVALIPAASSDPGTALGHLEAVVHAVVERATLATTRLQSAIDALPAAKVAAVAASTAALAGGGAAIEHVTRPHLPARPAAAVSAAAPERTSATPSLTTLSILQPQQTAAGTKTEHERAEPTGEFGIEEAPAARSEFVEETPADATAHAAATPSAPALKPSSAPQTTTPPAPTAPPQPERTQPSAEFAGF